MFVNLKIVEGQPHNRRVRKFSYVVCGKKKRVSWLLMRMLPVDGVLSWLLIWMLPVDGVLELDSACRDLVRQGGDTLRGPQELKGN